MKAFIAAAFRCRTNRVIGILLVGTILLVACPNRLTRAKPTGAGVHGSVFVQVRKTGSEPTAAGGMKVYLPDLEVYLKDIHTGDESKPEVTDLFGRYMFPIQKPGTYRLLWKAQNGWAAGGYADTIVIYSNTQYPVSTEVMPEKKAHVIGGTIKLADGGTPWFHDEFFGITETTTISVLDTTSNPVAKPVRANASGKYAVAMMASGTMHIRFQNGSEQKSQSMAIINSFSSLNYTSGNHRPQIRGFVAKKYCSPGETIMVHARGHEYDNDKISFTWKNTPGTGKLTPSADSATWELPKEPGDYSVYVIASDARGGYATQRLTVHVGKKDALFVGKVVNANGKAIAGAHVSINGTTQATDTNGAFSLKTALSGLYVMNISKTGYALFSRRFNQAQTGQTWSLTQTQITTVDPTLTISIIDRRPELEKQHRKGAQINIAPNSLVDSSGNLPAGSLNASVATLDIAGGEAPGDWGGLQEGKEVNLISYGAVFVEFRDAAGKKFNIAPGKEAEVIMPVLPSMNKSIANAVPLWSYDEHDGLWKPSGMAKINKTTGVYTGKVTHFSTINTDLSKTDASCLKVVLNSSIPAGMRLRITDVPGGVDFAQTFEFTMNDVVNAVYRLPPNTNVKLDLLDLNNNILGNLSVEEIPGISLPGNIINSGPPIPAGHTLWPDPNTTEIDDCKAVTLSLKIPDWSGFPASPFLTFKDVGDATKAAGYYSTVDPSSLRTTLGDWWSTNGFDINGQAIDAVRTSYLNNNDLGSGRDMYLLQHPDGRVSAYVTNYGLFDQNPANADLADTKTNPGATVCMEYSPVEGAANTTKIVKFFVFAGNGNGALAPRVTSANLDGAGDKYVPNLCLNCHGGSYVPANPSAPIFDEVNMHASLREFDLATYKYPGFRTIPNSGEKDRFKQQNLIVKASLPQQAIVELIDGWYAGGTSDQNAGYAPPGWSGAPQAQLYHDVVSNSCRTCHVAFESDASPFGLNWVTYAQFRTRRNIIRDYVCGTDKVMPHALVTYKNFWLSTSPSRPASLGTFTTVDWTAFGSCQ